MTIKVQNLVWDSSIKGPSKRFVLLALADRASDQGEITAFGIDELCGKTGIARSTVFGILKQLEETDNLIQRVEQHNPDGSQRYSRFWINLPLLRALKRPDAERRSEDDATNPFSIFAAQNPVQDLDPPPVTQGPDPGPPGRPDPGPSPRPDPGPPGRPDPGPLNPNSDSNTNERRTLPNEVTPDAIAAWRETATAIVETIPLDRIDPKPTQVRQIRDVVAAALAHGYPEDQVRAYLALKVSEARVVKYVLGAFAAHRLVDIPAALMAAPAGLPPVCGACDARPSDPVSARVEWLDDEKTTSRPCPRCHPKAA